MQNRIKYENFVIFFVFIFPNGSKFFNKISMKEKELKYFMTSQQLKNLTMTTFVLSFVHNYV